MEESLIVLEICQMSGIPISASQVCEFVCLFCRSSPNFISPLGTLAGIIAYRSLFTIRGIDKRGGFDYFPSSRVAR